MADCRSRISKDPSGLELLSKLYPGSSVANPIDFLATGTAAQLGTIIDYVDRRFDDIDAMVVIFGTPGLTRIFDVYDVLHEKMRPAASRFSRAARAR
jgi:acetate---CoA ligase (ADP-forming)